MGGFNISANIDSDIVQSPQGYTSCFLNFAFGLVCDMQDLYSRIPCQNSIPPIVPLFSRLGQTHSSIWGPSSAENGMVLI
jgi:hypothetical protein